MPEKEQAMMSDDTVEVPLSEELKSRAVLFLNGAISDTHLSICSMLLDYNYNADFNDPITLIINSPGGICSVGWSIVDVMNHIRLPVHTVALGTVGSMAADIFVNGDKRTMGAHSTLLVHPHSVMRYGSHNNLIANHKMDMIEHGRRLTHYLNNSKYDSIKSIEENLLGVKGDDLWLTPEEVLSHGLCDEIAKSNKVKRKKNFGFTVKDGKEIIKSKPARKRTRSR